MENAGGSAFELRLDQATPLPAAATRPSLRPVPTRAHRPRAPTLTVEIDLRLSLASGLRIWLITVLLASSSAANLAASSSPPPCPPPALGLIPLGSPPEDPPDWACSSAMRFCDEPGEVKVRFSVTGVGVQVSAG